MAIRISWKSPSNTNVHRVEIDRATTKFGGYSVLSSTYNSTSDGGIKVASNNWVTTYTDTGGSSNNWYKIRFKEYVSSTWSQYSDPIAGAEEVKLCTIEDVQNVIDTVGRFSDDEIFAAIQEEEDLIYIESGTPIAGVRSTVDRLNNVLQDTYYVGEENIYRIDRVFYGTVTKSELFLDDNYKVNTRYGMVRILPVSSGGPLLDDGTEIEMRYVPRVYNRLATYRAAKRLLEKIDYLGAGTVSKELDVVNKRLLTIEKILQEQIGIRLSSDYAYYNPVYGVNTMVITQDHSRNRYYASYGWN